MPHLKKEFKFHRLFNTKYVQQTLLAYRWRGNTKYVQNNTLPFFIVFTIDFVIRVNNMICRRGSVESNINDIDELYNRYAVSPNNNMYYYSDITFDIVYNYTIEKNNKEKFINEYEIYFFNTLKELNDWKVRFKDNYEEFKDYIYDLIKLFDENHYTWLVGENIIYSYSTWENIERKVYCAVISEKKFLIFKKLYLDMVYVDEKNIDNLVEQITSLLVAVADVKNDLSLRKYDEAIENLSQYLLNNKDMCQCKDIYYIKLYKNMENILFLLKNKGISKAKKIIDEIIEFENNKYSIGMLLFEKIPIDDDSFENSQYIEL